MHVADGFQRSHPAAETSESQLEVSLSTNSCRRLLFKWLSANKSSCRSTCGAQFSSRSLKSRKSVLIGSQLQVFGSSFKTKSESVWISPSSVRTCQKLVVLGQNRPVRGAMFWGCSMNLSRKYRFLRKSSWCRGHTQCLCRKQRHHNRKPSANKQWKTVRLLPEPAISS